MPFIDLGADVLGHIFALSDVYTILSLSQTNDRIAWPGDGRLFPNWVKDHKLLFFSSNERPGPEISLKYTEWEHLRFGKSIFREERLFHEIASTKQLWLSVVRNLFAQRLIDTPLDCIGKLSKDALIDEVKRVVDGPRTWSPKSLVPPKLSRRRTVEVDSAEWAGLLPGNAYIVCYFGGPFRTVGCLEIDSGRLAWEWSRPGFNVDIATFDFLGTSEAVDPQLSGDLFICKAQARLNAQQFILLWNWRAEKFIVPDGIIVPPGTAKRILRFYSFESFILLPGHLLTRHEYGLGYTTSLQHYLYPIANFDRLWRPTREFTLDDLIDIEQLSSAHLQVDDKDTLATVLHYYVGRALFTMTPTNSWSYSTIRTPLLPSHVPRLCQSDCEFGPPRTTQLLPFA
ncbi:hypothetical protein B0H19DRAFT_1066964 [Mycena capillaripes]|nr:hypothetical protein B0H19DRAFT_1066964 [Mycena capillaripes]